MSDALAVQMKGLGLSLCTCDQTVVQRYLVARTDRQAVRGVLIGSLFCVPVWALFMLIGTLCWTFFKLTGEALPAQFGRGDQAFPYFVTHHLPAGFAGLFIAALFGATMANLSSDLNSLAAVAVEDYYRLWFRGSSERARLIAAKVAVVICGAICMAVASVLGHSNGSALSLWFTISAIATGGLVGLFALAFLTPRANATGAYVGIAASLLFTTWAVLTQDGGKIWNLGRGNFPLHNFMVGAIGQVLCFGIGYLASLPFQSSRNSAPELTIWSWIKNSRMACEPSLKG